MKVLIKKSSNAVLGWKKKVETMRALLYKIQHKSITSFAEGILLDFATCMQCLSEKNKKHFADSRIGFSRAYKRTMVAGKELLNFEDLQESCNQLFKQVPGGLITSITSKEKFSKWYEWGYGMIFNWTCLASVPSMPSVWGVMSEAKFYIFRHDKIKGTIGRNNIS